MDNTVGRTPPLIRSDRASPQLLTAPTVLASALLAFASGGCEPATSSDTATPDRAIRSDSAGVQLVEYLNLPPTEESRISIADEPELVLGEGGAFAGPDHEFFQIMGVSQLRDGALVVANRGSSELRFYEAEGRFLRSVGGEGEGPGEFRYLWDHWIMAGDTIVAWDWQARSLQQFSPDGAFVRSASMITAPFAGFSTASQPQMVTEDGRVAVFIESLLTPTLDVPERQPLLVALHRISDGGWDSVQVVPGHERIVAMDDSGLMTLPGYHFGAYPVAAGAGLTMAVADGAHFRIKLFDPEGRLVSILSASVPEVAVTADVIEGQIEHMVAFPPAWAEGERAAEYEERLRESVRASHAPFLPAIRDVFVDSDERIWVERYDVPARSPSRWEVFERDGTWVGRVEMPEGFARGTSARVAPGFSVASGRLAGVWLDPDTGVETVRVYRVIEPDS